MTADLALITALRGAPLFESLDDEDLRGLVPYLTQASYEEGDVLIQEESDGRNLMLVVEGRAGVFKQGGQDAAFRIGGIGPGEVLGEMSFLESGQARSATIRAESGLRALILSWDAFEEFGEVHSRAAHRIVVNIAKRVSGRVRSLNADTVLRLEQEVQNQKERAMMGRLVTYVILLLFGYNLTLQATMQLSTDPFWANVISFGIVSVYGIALVILVKQAGYPWSEYGLTLRGWRSSLGESLAWTLAVALLLTLLKWILVSVVPRYSGIPVFGPFEGTLSIWALTIYGLLAPVQEFIARGVLQSSFERFYTGRRGPLVASIVANALFSAAHVHLSAAFAAVVFLPGLLWGYLYSRNKTLIGVSVSHILLGWYAVFVLRFAYLAGM